MLGINLNYKSIIMLAIILLTSNIMVAQTIYDKNGAMFSFTKDSYKPNISYYNSIGIDFCVLNHLSIKPEVGFIEIGEYFQPTSLNTVNSHIDYITLSLICDYLYKINNHKIYAGFGPSLGFRYKSCCDFKGSKIEQPEFNQEFSSKNTTLFINGEVGYSYYIDRIIIGAVIDYQVNVTKIIPKSYRGYINHGIGVSIKIGYIFK